MSPAVSVNRVMNELGAPCKHRFSVETFHQIQNLGFLPENQRFELVEGEIIAKPLPSGAQAGGVLKILHHLTACINGKTMVNMHNSIQLGRYSETEPDLCLLTLNNRYYQQNAPKADDLLLVIEWVDPASDNYLRKVKMPLYARHGISEVWLVDFTQSFVDVGRVPAVQGYTQIKRYTAEQAIYPQLLPNVAVEVKYFW